ncbi:cation:proton antiporter [Altererythrobacter sp. KTW20L]|uniref:cation:proton antiporter domain-containing protein n=1 Tax=Altererythrobacter sp. KTW20L TaxID=2942210 RepID=UPI0020BF0802|nr:cation:proton antiporter [Altererythrobacter sp. KTW20L]MCL6251784.1 cation:proton antiporter [Altererythrobacter sp. KTW20L]
MSDALVILGAAGIVIPLFARFRITPIIGFILVGLLVGPYGLGRMVYEHEWLTYVTITDPERLEPFAEFGIVLLLFTIGLELSFSRLWSMRRMVFGLGALELIVIGSLLAAFLSMMGQYWTGAIALGLALAMSSTAVVLPISGTQTPVGKAALSMLLFEGLALVPIIFLLGTLAPYADSESDVAMGQVLLQGFGVIVAMLVLGRIFLPRLFALAARAKSSELFLSASLLVVLGASIATTLAGLSPIVGALLAGLLIAETDYSLEVAEIIDPFRRLALGVFLLTVGMTIDLAVVWEHLWSILVATFLVLSLKAVVTGILLRSMGARRSTASETGILMSSPSEDTLIIIAAATAAALIQPGTGQFWQIVTALGMTVTPLLGMIGRRVARRIEGTNQPSNDFGDEDEPRILILGFGRIGRVVADMLKRHHLPFIAIDADPALVERARRDGIPAVFGNATQGGMLERLGLERAPAVILTMDEHILAQRVVRRLRADWPDLTIIARARDSLHAAELYRSGVTVAVPETLESSLQLSEAVLVELGVPMGHVIASIHEKRDEFRERIRKDGALDEKPKLRTSSAET